MRGLLRTTAAIGLGFSMKAVEFRGQDRGVQLQG